MIGDDEWRASWARLLTRQLLLAQGHWRKVDQPDSAEYQAALRQTESEMMGWWHAPDSMTGNGCA